MRKTVCMVEMMCGKPPAVKQKGLMRHAYVGCSARCINHRDQRWRTWRHRLIITLDVLLQNMTITHHVLSPNSPTDCDVRPGASIPMGQGGHVPPNIYEGGDIHGNVPAPNIIEVMLFRMSARVTATVVCCILMQISRPPVFLYVPPIILWDRRRCQWV